MAGPSRRIDLRVGTGALQVAVYIRRCPQKHKVTKKRPRSSWFNLNLGTKPPPLHSKEPRTANFNGKEDKDRMRKKRERQKKESEASANSPATHPCGCSKADGSAMMLDECMGGESLCGLTNGNSWSVAQHFHAGTFATATPPPRFTEGALSTVGRNIRRLRPARIKQRGMLYATR